MKKALSILAAVCLVASLAVAGQAPAKKLKVFVSVDMEGVAGLIHWDETGSGGPDYQLFRTIMTGEANAAVAGAFEAGATEVVVRDAHDSARNILPDQIDPRARLIREWNGPLSMMEGIDRTFDAVVFVGNHARAGTPNAVLKHTMSLSLFDVILNGVRMPEGGLERGHRRLFRRAGRLPLRRYRDLQADPGDHRADRDRRRQRGDGTRGLHDPPFQGPGDDPERRPDGPEEPQGL